MSNLDSQLDFIIHSPHPNPFNSTTTITFELPAKSSVKLEVFDITGRAISTLIDGWRNAGWHTVTFDGNGLASGLYFYKMETEGFIGYEKMVLLK
jgi:hypothetical protein